MEKRSLLPSEAHQAIFGVLLVFRLGEASRSGGFFAHGVLFRSWMRMCTQMIQVLQIPENWPMLLLKKLEDKDARAGHWMNPQGF